MLCCWHESNNTFLLIDRAHALAEIVAPNLFHKHQQAFVIGRWWWLQFLTIAVVVHSIHHRQLPYFYNPLD